MEWSRIKEYAKLIPRGIPNISQIVNGIVNNVEMKYGGLREEERDEIIKRRVLCETCPFNSLNASDEYFEVTGEHYVSKRGDFHCSFCGCPIEIRTASLDSNCGIEYWNTISENKLPLKWKKYGKEVQNTKSSSGVIASSSG